MKIEQSKINNVTNYLKLLSPNQSFYVGIKDLHTKEYELNLIGFKDSFEIGEEFLPKNVGNVSNFNRIGETVVDKTKSKIYQYRTGTTTDWHGNKHTSSIRYKGYPKIEIPAPRVKMSISNDGNERILISPKFENIGDKNEIVKHTINLFLEIFGECIILNESFQPIISNVKKLSWKILPKGEQIWKNVEKHIEEIIASKNLSDEVKQEIFSRIQLLTNSKKDFVAYGEEGFKGYLIFGFENKAIFICESVYIDNATYVFGNDWEELSKMTKSEILKGNRHKEKIIHNKSWISRINELIK